MNVRIVAATNRDLDEPVRAGNFRAGLMYRLKVFQIQIPPLRARAEDIPVLAAHFLAQLAAGAGPTANAGASVSLDTLEREHLQKALAQCGGNATQSARVPGIGRDTLRYRMQRHGLQR